MQEYSKFNSYIVETDSTTESWLEPLKPMCRFVQKISLISCPRTYIFTGIRLALKKLVLDQELQTWELSATIEQTSADEQVVVEEHNLQITVCITLVHTQL